MGQTNVNPLAGYDIAKHIKECIEPYLEMTSEGLPPRRCVHVGAIAWDDCECGQLIVALQSAYEAVGTNLERSGSVNPGRRECGPPLFNFNLMVSMLRCAPIGEGDNPPTCAELDQAAKISVEDAWAVRAGVICCLSSAIKDRLPNGTKLYVDFTVGTQTFIGPDGMCQGSNLPVSVTIQNGCYPCDES